MNRRLLYISLLAVLAGGLVVPAGAAEVRKERNLGTFGVWHALAYDEGSQTVCYMVTAKAVATKGKGAGRKSYLMITHRPIEASSDVFSYGAGEPLDSKHDVTLRIAKEDFELFSVKETAWARDPLTDHKIAAAIRNSPAAQITAIPAQSRVTTIADKFSLTGALSAYRAINKACGLPDVVPVKKEAVKKAAVKKTEVKKAAPHKPAAKTPAIKNKIVQKPVAQIPGLKKASVAKTTATKAKTTK